MSEPEEGDTVKIRHRTGIKTGEIIHDYRDEPIPHDYMVKRRDGGSTTIDKGQIMQVVGDE